MPREIIHVQVGQCGNQVGRAFWETVAQEHKIGTDAKFDPALTEGGGDADGDGTPDELENVSVYFREVNTHYVARSVIVDLEPGTIDVLKGSTYNKIFDPANCCFGANGAGNNWAKGHYTEGAELVEEAMDIIRKGIEDCDAPQGFQLMHSLGGGTGSGMGTLLLLKIRDAYPDRITTTYSIYPSPKVSDTVVEPYNAVLSSHQLLENSDETFIIDNEALYNISHNTLKVKNPTYSELNTLISSATCGITASLRFPGKLNGDLRKLGVNLVPFPRLHFFLVSQAPICSKDSSAMVINNVKELTSQAYSSRNFYSNVKPDDGKYLAASFGFRGDMNEQEIDEIMLGLQSKADQDDEFVAWIPNNIKSGLVQVAGYVSGTTTRTNSTTLVANTTALKGIFQRLATQFGAMYKRKAFLHWYKGEGMDEMEFQEADKNVRDLITEYQDKQDAVYEEEEASGEEEDSDL